MIAAALQNVAAANQAFSAEVLKIDAEAEAKRIIAWMRDNVLNTMRRRGVVIGLSGGIDSSVCAALAGRAFGSECVLGLLMPEQDSSYDSEALGQLMADHLAVEAYCENVGPLLEAAGCYKRRDDAIRTVVPEYGPGWKSKLVLPGLSGSAYRVFSLIVQSPFGEQRKVRLTLDAYQTIVAATNFKQRCRKMMEYYHADRLRYAVVGTPNRLEYDQGFFVKNGDGASDIKPIAHLYKSQVYQLADYLGVPEIIRMRPPTTDTYSLEQTQEEFFFSVPYQTLDLCLYGHNHGVPAAFVAEAAALRPEQVERVYADIDSKRKATAYLHLRPQLAAEISEITY